jgi:hypothetical protein
MKKLFFCFVVAGATLVSAIVSASPAGAVNYLINNVTYDVQTQFGTFDDLQLTLTAASNVVWGNAKLAYDLASVSLNDLGFPNGIGDWSDSTSRGPYFAFDHYQKIGYGTPANPLWVSSVYFAQKVNFSICCSYPVQVGSDPEFGNSAYGSIGTYATATAVPWEISGSATIFGSITGIGLGIGLNRLKSKISEKEE